MISGEAHTGVFVEAVVGQVHEGVAEVGGVEGVLLCREADESFVENIDPQGVRGQGARGVNGRTAAKNYLIFKFKIKTFKLKFII